MPNNNMDRFTRLPDVLLVAIISLLPFKEAARTSILAKRLRFLWRATKNIDLNESFFVKPEHSVQEREEQRGKFIAFAHEWITNYQEPNIESFRLSFSDPLSFSLVMEQCIAFASTRNVKYLVLDFSDPSRDEEANPAAPAMYVLPVQFYENREVEFLQLFCCSIKPSRFRTFASALKHLSLGWIELDSLSLNVLLFYCPRIVSLHLKKCWFLDTLNISVPSTNSALTSLEIDRCSIDEELMKISAPHLKFLKYTGGYNIFSLQGNHGEMVAADLDYGLVEEFYNAGDDFYWFFHNIRSVRVLTICSYMLQVLPAGMESQLEPPLHVQQLALKTAMHENDFLGITFFLKSCPYLESLFIDIGPMRMLEDYESPCEIDPYSYWIRNVVAAVCITNSLRAVEIKGFKGTDNELQFLHYILKYGRVMERLFLIVATDSDGRNVESYKRNAQELERFERASNMLQIWIVG